jgi:hypothetical protein
MVAERHRLRGLQVGKAWHHGRGVRQRLLGQRLLVAGERVVDRIDGRTHPEPEVGRDLIIARARGVQPPGRGPYQFRQPALDVHVNVFERAAEGKGSGLDL